MCNKPTEPFQKKEVSLSILDKIFLLIGSFTLLPVRIIIFINCFMLVWVCARIGLIGMDETKPASGFRRILQRFNYMIGRFMFKVCCGFISPEIIGDLLPPEDAPVVVAAPHTSFFDIWIFCWLAMDGFCYAISREEVKDILFVGTIGRFHQMHFVRRSCEVSRQKTKDTIVSRSQDKDWGRLIIFPEGMCGNGSSLLPFRKGGFLQGIGRIQPVILRYPNRVDCTTWHKGNDSMLTTIMVMVRAMATLYSMAELEALPAITPEGDPEVFAELVRESMGERMGLPLHHNKED